MALTQSQLEARIAELRQIRDSGVFMTRHGDTSNQFRTLAELNDILTSLEGELDALTEAAPKEKVRYIIQTGKGF
jgi:hypothetical protein